MKYQVNVVKKVAFLIMTMALAVAMVACSGGCGYARTGWPGRTARSGRSDARSYRSDRRLRRRLSRQDRQVTHRQ